MPLGQLEPRTCHGWRHAFFLCSPAELLAAEEKYYGCFSKEAISHVPADSRTATVEAIGAALRPSAYFVLSYVVDDAAPGSGAAQLRSKEREHYDDVWNVPNVMSVVKSADLKSTSTSPSICGGRINDSGSERGQGSDDCLPEARDGLLRVCKAA